MFSQRNRRRGGRGRRGTGWGVDGLFWMLTMQLFNQIQRMEHKPPVTLGLIAVNYLIFLLPSLPQSSLPTGYVSAARFALGVTQLDKLIPSSREGGIIPSAVIQGGQWGRLFWGTLLHADTMHLYYNMSSLLFKGVQLEPALGSVGFACLVGELWVVCAVLYCGVQWGGYQLMGAWSSDAVRSYNTALVGFSGVLFGLKAVLMAHEHRWQYVTLPIIGMPVSLPPKVVAWAELLLIKFMVPNSSFTGHLCGLLAGLIHTNVTARLLRPMVGRAGARGRRRTQGGYSSGANFNTGYPQQPGYPPGAGYAQQGGYPQGGSYYEQSYTGSYPGYPQPGFSQPAPGTQQPRQRRGRWW